MGENSAEVVALSSYYLSLSLYNRELEMNSEVKAVDYFFGESDLHFYKVR